MATQQSTYTRPIKAQEPLNGATVPVQSPGVSGGNLNALNAIIASSPRRTYTGIAAVGDNGISQQSVPGGNQRVQPPDRPKSKHLIPGCAPWLLIKTKLGRRFVYNPETQQSLWKFPLDVMKGVVEYDRIEREKKENPAPAQKESQGTIKPSINEETQNSTVQGANVTTARTSEHPGYDGEEYEEVEVTDDEGEGQEPKRQKTGDNGELQGQAVEFNEDDIAYQLAAMGQDYGLDPDEYGEGQDHEGAEGLQLTMEDSKALFFDLLDDYRISPYSTWERIMEEGYIIEDDRYVALPTMKARKEVWSEWSRDRIQKLKEDAEQRAKQDPSIHYMAFLEEHATPKLYWPEFKRKYRKEPEMHNTKLSDKDREKWYRDYISRLKLPESRLKADLIELLRSLPLQALNKSVTLETLPSNLLKDLRYVSLRRSVRDPIIAALIESLPPAPEISDEVNQEAVDRRKQEREGRERALAERQRQVNEEKRRQQGALRQSRVILRQEEEELERARQVGRAGLLSHAEVEQDAR